MGISMEVLEQYYPIFAVIIVPLIIFIVLISYIWFKDKYEREPAGLVMLMFFWGAGVAFLSLLIENSAQGLMTSLYFAILFAPFLEELLKGLGLLLLSRHKEYEGIMDGLVYGVAVGAGFAFLGDALYGLSFLYTGTFMAALTAVLTRSLIEPLAHPFFSAWFGAEIGKSKMRIKGPKDEIIEIRVGGRITSFIVALLTVFTLHALWNYVAIMSIIDIAQASLHAVLVVVLFISLFICKIKDGVAFEKLVFEVPRKRRK